MNVSASFLNQFIHTVFFLFLCFLLSACNPESIATPSEKLDDEISYNDLVESLPSDYVNLTTEAVDQFGALGRNKSTYIHARFQMPQSKLVDYAVHFENIEGVEQFLKSLEYAFAHQTAEGDFEFVIPDSLQQDTGTVLPTPGDLASAAIFYAYSTGLGYCAIQNSPWFTQLSTYNELNQRLNDYLPLIEKMLNFIIVQKDLLLEYDSKAPNRLLFDAIAYYTLGDLLDNSEAHALCVTFLNRALSLQHEQGYFIEKGGWDSSYNGVALKLAIELFVLLKNLPDTKKRLEKVIIASAQWQKGRVLPDGEISTEGNTRVFPGGEDFLGTEKQVDVEKTIRAFFYMHTLANNSDYYDMSQTILSFYVN